jgi:predicted amidophosphoribosyltransferase
MRLSSARLLASFVAPPRCAGCASACGGSSPLCERCKAELAATEAAVEAGPPGLALAVAASGFDGVARRVAHGLKYARRLSLARVAAAAMLGALPPEERRGTVVPVPPGPWRWRWRGFDSAEEIAIALAEMTGLSLARCLRRSRGPRQVGRTRAERLADPPRVWVDGVAPETALLIDDVRTTGATLSACALALGDAGCRRVVALTLARAL